MNTDVDNIRKVLLKDKELNYVYTTYTVFDGKGRSILRYDSDGITIANAYDTNGESIKKEYPFNEDLYNDENGNKRFLVVTEKEEGGYDYVDQTNSLAKACNLACKSGGIVIVDFLKNKRIIDEKNQNIISNWFTSDMITK